MARKFKLGKLFRTTFGKPDAKDSVVSKSQRSKHSDKPPEVIQEAEEAEQEPSEEDAAGEPELPNPPSEPDASPAKGMGKELSILSLVQNSVTSNFPPSEVAEAEYKATDYKLGSKSIQLHIHEAHDLGRGWKTDPYVLVVFSNNRVLHSRKRHAWSTRYIRRTRNPKWDEEATIPLTSGSAGSGQYLHFIVMTWGGKLKHDDILGRVTIDTHSPEFLKNAGKQQWYPLMRMKTDALAQGELSCSYRLLSEAPLPLGPASVTNGSRKSARDTHMGPRKRLEVYGSLNLRVRVTGIAAFQPSQIHKGIYVTIDTGTWAAKTRKLLSFQTSGAFDLLWNEEFAVAMEDALTPPKTKTTDAFLNNLLLREPRAFDDVVFKLKRRRPAKAHPELLGVAHVPLSTIPIRGAPSAAAARQTSALTPISSRPSTPARGSIVGGDDAWGPFKPAPSHDSENWMEERGLSARHPELSGYSDVSTPQLNGPATNGHRKATSHEMMSPFNVATSPQRPGPAPPDRGRRWAVHDEAELPLAPRHGSSPELGVPQQGSRDDARGKDPAVGEGTAAVGSLPQLRLPASSAGQAEAPAGGGEHAASQTELPAGRAQDAADAAGAGDAAGAQGYLFERVKHGLEDMVQGLTRNLPDLGMSNGAGGPPKLDTTSEVLSMGEMEEHEEEMEEEEEGEDVELEEIKLLIDRGANKPALQLDVALAFEHSNLHQKMEEQEDDSSLLVAEKDPSAPEPKPMAMPSPHSTELVHATLPIGPHHLFVLLFSSSSEFYTGFHTRSNNRNLKVGNWKQQDGKKKRLVTYTMPLKGNSFGPKEAEAEETQSLEVREDGGWHVEVRASTPRVPYGSTFHNQVQFAATSAGRGRTELRITAYVEFYKSVMVRSLIEKASLEGLKATYSTYLAALQDEVGAPVPGAASAAPAPSGAEVDSGRGKQLALLLRSMEGQVQLALLLGVPLLLGLVAVPTRVMTVQEALSACHYLGLALLVLQVAALGSMALDRERRQRQALVAAQPGADADKAEAEARQPAPRTERQGGKGTFLLRRLSGSPAGSASEQGKKAESGRRLTGPKLSLGSVQED